MTANEFRKLALSLPGAVESAHMDHPDFRVEGKIFATLGHPDDGWGMVGLAPEQQAAFIKKAPGMFNPCNGAWGQRGATNVHLVSAKKSVLKTALNAAFKHAVARAKTKKR